MMNDPLYELDECQLKEDGNLLLAITDADLLIYLLHDPSSRWKVLEHSV